MRFLIICIIFTVSSVITAVASPSGNDGVLLYKEHCSACHGPLKSTAIHNRPSGRIESAIRVFPAMQPLNYISKEQIRKISQALKKPL